MDKLVTHYTLVRNDTTKKLEEMNNKIMAFQNGTNLTTVEKTLQIK